MSTHNNNGLNPLVPVLDHSLITAQELLEKFAFDVDFSRQIKLVFGNNVDVDKTKSIVRDLARGNLSFLPKIEIRSATEINGAKGAFAGANNTIYLSREFLNQNANNVEAIADVLLEEMGHAIDFRLNASDTPGDEGEIFSALVRGIDLTPNQLQAMEAEDDTAIILVNGQSIQVEQATSPTVTVTKETGFDVASELGPYPGIFKFTRTGDISQPLTATYTLGGSATKGSDYLVWENSVKFAAGSNTAYVTVLPKNDALQESPESITLTLNSGTGYTVGTSNSATITLQDAFVNGFRGVLDPVQYPYLAQDIQYLDAQISNGQLIIDLVLSNLAVNNIEIFLDTDRNPSTGDIRFGHVGGAEYRISAFTQGGFSIPGVPIPSFCEYGLYQLPRTDAEVIDFGNLSNRTSTEKLLLSNTISFNGNPLELAIPLTAIGNPSAADVFAVAHINNPNGIPKGIGDRAPNFGVFDTSTRQVVIRQPKATKIATLNDPSGDSSNAPDLTSASFKTIGDQFSINLTFAQPINTGLLANTGINVVLDTDRSLLTGSIPMGGEIPTWGGDVILSGDFTTGVPIFLLQDRAGHKLTFGGDRNDGSWLVNGNSLILTGSLSLFDAFSLTGFPSLSDALLLSNGNSKRVPTDGDMYAQVFTFLSQNSFSPPNDFLPQQGSAVDTATGQVLAPFAWNPNKRISASDPREFPNPTSSDLYQVDAQVIEGNLVVKGFLTNWPETEVGNLFQILLDTDMNANTGERLRGIGVDYKVLVASRDAIVPTYTAVLETPDGGRQPHEAWLKKQTSGNLGEPGGFTVTIPLGALGTLGSELRLLVTAGYDRGAVLDFAPEIPMVINLGNNANTGTPGDDRLQGTSGNDTLDGKAGNDELLGLAGNDTLIGGAGNDTLNGGSGNDQMTGGTGNDTYIVDSTGDLITEKLNEGLDTVQASISFSLDTGNALNNLTLTGTGNISGTGNGNANVITGNSGNNALNGGAGNDTLTGGAGNDTLNGGSGNDSLTGGSGNDILVGGSGNGPLTGGSGTDRFTFNSASEGIDQITDFLVVDDTIAVSAAGFGGGLTANAVLAAAQFIIGTGATTASHRFIYNSSNGGLFFDSDGTGSIAQLQIATLSTGLAMTNADIFVAA
jgi:hypothetical protein